MMTRKLPARTTKVLSGYCVVVAENHEGKVKLFGSPAENPNLEVGDEILEVNGKKLDEATHMDVINHIHESIRSRRVSLKVRRRRGKRLVDEFPTYSIQNAYIVSSDNEVREKFDRQHKNDVLVPIDMTNLLFDGKAEDLTIPNAKLDAGISVVQPISQPLEPLLETSATHSEKAEEQIPSTLIPPVDIPEIHRSITTEDLLQRTLRNIETCIELSKRQEGVRFSITSDEEKYPVKILERLSPDLEERFPVKVSRKLSSELEERALVVPADLGFHLPAATRSSARETTLGATPVDEEMSAQIQFNNHREMAIDVPESFVGSIKRPPRLPGSSGSRESVIESEPVSTSPAVQEAERIKRYQAEIRRRNDEEQTKAKKEEILRTSLRGSKKKLQALERNAKPPPPPGFHNPAFEEEIHGSDVSGGSVVTSSIDDTEGVPDAQAMRAALDKITSALRRENGEFIEELNFIESFFNTPEFQHAADLHALIETQPQQSDTEPVTTNTEAIMETVRTLLPTCSAQDAQELQAVLSTPQFENLLRAHDKIAVKREELQQLQTDIVLNQSDRGSGAGNNVDGNSSFNSDAATMPVEECNNNGHSNLYPVSDSSPVQSNYVGVDMRVIRIEKHGGDPLGATIKVDPVTGGVMVARIVHGGAAQKSGVMHENDELLDVNGFDLRGKTLDEVCEILSKLSGTLTFVIIPAQAALIDMQPKRDSTMHVKAHFDFDPNDETYPEEVRCPCTDLGLQFSKGDILHVLNHDDRNWWQAYREGDEVGSTLAGLIPSKDFQQQREEHRLRKMGDGVYINGGRTFGKKHANGKQKKHKSKKRKRVVAGSPLDVDLGEVPWYEEVGVYYPKQNQKRPIILIGPAHVGRQELREKLMATDVDRFAPVIPHTTRTRREGEVNGYTYFFVSRSQFEDDIARGRFVEHGEFEKNLYGTSFDAIREVVVKGKICILNLQPQSLKLLRASDLKPYVVFIAPPSLDRLRQNRLRMGSPAKDDELKTIIDDAREMEETYGHFFDLVLVNADLDRAFEELLDGINRLEREPQWVPVEWLR